MSFFVTHARKNRTRRRCRTRIQPNDLVQITYTETVIDASFLLAESRFVLRIRLTSKFALCLNGVDVSNLRIGDEVDLPDRSAMLLLLEGWAEPVDPIQDPRNRPPVQRAARD
jgi:hypothetical protein